ncbi:hypothetical protein [Psychrobacter sp. FDAARGOS_221]|uniref:hypothetical protein n=1 Tax=Psychrobacter sp. FDAARGOS_221 TaxID=1975705 RepID=UPI000BB58397|nr:hypothetical protein [Psychrobacter sp. FDAARGOS_221]PNK59479.1 hypothetical protein A6J60_000290 [Psychrobacter sp. FDAARGOS_221]PNK59907.1 hypothetical protein A6J60_002780 [Psychrobacter sp. FDAARGOS_221]PNK61453.1 hypothetical protein A6J60_011655 [Psychrobacter sp. FDAARGOS_221]
MFEVYNSDGSLQVTANQAYDLSLTSTIIQQQASATYIDPSKIYALQPVADDDSGVTHLFFNPNKPDGLIQIAGSTGAKVHIFDYMLPQARQNEYGLEVYDSDGVITFSSRYPSLNVIDHIKADAGIDAQRHGRRNYGTTNLAIVPNKIPFIIQLGGVANLAYFITTVWTIEQGELCWYTKAVTTAPPFENFESSSAIDFLVIDTSHF